VLGLVLSQRRAPGLSEAASALRLRRFGPMKPERATGANRCVAFLSGQVQMIPLLYAPADHRGGVGADQGPDSIRSPEALVIWSGDPDQPHTRFFVQESKAENRHRFAVWRRFGSHRQGAVIREAPAAPDSLPGPGFVVIPGPPGAQGRQDPG